MSEIIKAARGVTEHYTGNAMTQNLPIALAFKLFADELERAENSAPNWPPAEWRTPTSELLNKAAATIESLMSGRGVDRRNGADWEGFITLLRERAASFKAHEDQGRI